MKNDYKGQKIALLGFDVEGRAAFKFLRSRGAELTILDQREDVEVPAGTPAVLGADYLKDLDRFDLIIRTPGVMPYLLATKRRVTTGTSLFLAHCPAAVIGVTGTKGKGTTAALIHHILSTAGQQTYLGGNIGRPGLDFIDELKAGDYVVLELSNLQLWDIEQSPPVGVLLRLFPEHLDWHRGNVAEYMATKANITKFQTGDDLLVYHGSNRYTRDIARASRARTLPFYTEKVQGAGSKDQAVWLDGDTVKVGETAVCSVSDVTLPGRHNIENVLAAVGATWEIVGEVKPIARAIRTFKGLPHRLELVREVKGVRYYDDSIGTAPETAMAAIDTFSEPKIMVLGGRTKGADFSELARAVVSGNVKHVILMGETAPKIQRALLSAGYPQLCMIMSVDGMREIVAEAARLARPGDVVLLAPAAASFDQFRDYRDRGEQFKRAVSDL